jgi:hypothetical protein
MTKFQAYNTVVVVVVNILFLFYYRLDLDPPSLLGRSSSFTAHRPPVVAIDRPKRPKVVPNGNLLN